MNTQFDLNAMLSAPAIQTVQQIPCDNLRPYHDHKFEIFYPKMFLLSILKIWRKFKDEKNYHGGFLHCVCV